MQRVATLRVPNPATWGGWTSISNVVQGNTVLGNAFIVGTDTLAVVYGATATTDAWYVDVFSLA